MSDGTRAAARRSSGKTGDGEHHDGAAKRASGPSTSRHAIPSGNQAAQRLFAAGAIHAELRVGAGNDPAEAAADLMASRLLSGTGAHCDCAGGESCSRCAGSAGASQQTVIRRKPRAARGDPGSSSPSLALGTSQPLGASEQARFQPQLDVDLAAVRVHTGDEAAAAADAIGARAFAHGGAIAFARGEYQPHTASGQQLLAHELAHVAQDGDVIRREENDDVGGVCRVPTASPADQLFSPKPDPSKQVCRAPGADAPPGLGLTGDVDERIAAFKQLVRTTAVHRLKANQRNLALWSIVVDDAIPDRDLGAIGLAQSGGERAYLDMQDTADPGMRELQANQAVGRFRACTGCHIAKELHGSRSDRQRMDLNQDQWLTPNDRRQGAHADPFAQFGGMPSLLSVDSAFRFQFLGGSAPSVGTVVAPTHPSTLSTFDSAAVVDNYKPRSGTLEATLHQALPAPADLAAAKERIAPILAELGPAKYKVLPPNMLMMLETGTMLGLRDEILSLIRQRVADYGTLIGKIDCGEMGYEHFGPIIVDLLPMADAEVRAAIQKEMDDKAYWDKVKAVAIGVLTVLALILAIFPPTSALGLAAFGALEVGLATYGVQHGLASMETGKQYGLATGAHDVLTRSQQESGAGMVMGGFISVVLAPLGLYSGAARLEQAGARFGQMSSRGSTAMSLLGDSAAAQKLLAGGPRTFAKGDFFVTIAEDGSITATMASRPDVLIIMRDGTATVYQSMGAAGMRVIGSQRIGAAAANADDALAGMNLLGAGDDAAAASHLVPTNPTSSLMVPPGPSMPMLSPPGPAPSGLFLSTPQPPLMLSSGAPSLLKPPVPPSPLMLPPGPRPPLMLGPGAPTDMTWAQIQRLRQPQLWQETENYMQQLYGAPGQRHFRVPDSGGRFVDTPVTYGGGKIFAGEVKSYTRWITVEGQAVRNEVTLSARIEKQIAHDVWLRQNVPGYDPRWMFTHAPPSEALRVALRREGIAFIEYGP